jgi:hypothetical protein
MTEREWLTSEDPQAMLSLLQRMDDLQHRGRLKDQSSPLLISDRKLRLFACACCRLVWDRITDPRSRAAVEAAERYADGEATRDEAEALYRASCDAAAQVSGQGDEISRAAWAVANGTATDRDVASSVRFVLSYLPLRSAAQAALLREVVSPFRPVTLPDAICGECGHLFVPAHQRWYECPACFSKGPFRRGECPWLTPTVRGIVTLAYDSRDFAALPVLADALEEAGCDNEEILRHLQGWEKADENTHSDNLIWVQKNRPHVRGCWVLDLLLGNS